MKTEIEVRPHPAAFSDCILTRIVPWVEGYNKILDPFAGVGKVHYLALLGHDTVGIELEPEWAAAHPRTQVGNALELPFKDKTFDAICVSPCYGSRMADSHHAMDGSKRITYTHYIRRDLHPQNAGQMHWHNDRKGDAYRSLHQLAWLEAVRVLRHGGRFVLNCSDHIRRGERQRVTSWHVNTLIGMGLSILDWEKIDTPRHRFGKNHDVRVDAEDLVILERK